MKRINVTEVTNVVEVLCQKACSVLDKHWWQAMDFALTKEESPIGRDILNQLKENARLAAGTGGAICQDTGVTVVFLEVGQEVKLTGGNLYDAINEGVRRGYTKGYLRKSVVGDPLLRKNTGDNTPAIIHADIVDGEALKITVAPKGVGSENMSAIRMLKPAEGVEGIKNFVLQVVQDAGANPCPPIVIGIGIGGNLEQVGLIAKKSLLRPLSERNSLPHLAQLEEEILDEVNSLGIGPQGLGGRVTALDVHIETYPTHIGGLPTAVNIQCHAARHASAVL